MNDLPNIDSPRTNFTFGAAINTEEIGYVIWSSTRSGERPSQSVYTITCTSLRSGMASRGVRISAQMAAPMPKSVSRMTRKGLRALVSMIRSSSGVECRASERGACSGIGAIGESEGITIQFAIFVVSVSLHVPTLLTLPSPLLQRPLNLGLGVNQEICAGDHALAFGEAGVNGIV